jgi:single-strand DNA-binding protein
MSDLNSVCLVGRITRDVEKHYTARERPVYCFSIASNRQRIINKEWKRVPHYFDFHLLGEKWEGISCWLLKGQLVAIQGHLEQVWWGKVGKKQSGLKIVIEKINPLWSGQRKDMPSPLPEQKNIPSPDNGEEKDVLEERQEGECLES